MVVKVHGFKLSTCTRRVLTVLEEKKVPYEVVTVDLLKGEQKSPAFLQKQPFGKVPVLEDDGVFIFESRGIAKYVAKKWAGQGTKLIPGDDEFQAYGLFEQACSIETSYFDESAAGIAAEKVFKVRRGGTTDEQLVKKYEAGLDAALKVYDGILAKQKYLAGDELTLADLFHLPYGKMVRDLGYKEVFERYPNVNKWFETLEKRESWIKVNQA